MVQTGETDETYRRGLTGVTGAEKFPVEDAGDLLVDPMVEPVIELIVDPVVDAPAEDVVEARADVAEATAVPVEDGVKNACRK